MTRWIAPGILALFAAGCASVPKEAGFPDVEKLVSERTGGARLRWDQARPEDQAVAAHIRELLEEELSADRAVEIALLNNRAVQAVYEDLSVAQADLVQAGLLSNPEVEAEIRFPLAGGGPGAELTLVESFLDLFTIPLRKRVAGAAFEAAKLRVAGAVLDLAGETRATFYAVLAAEELRAMRETVLSATEASYDMAKRIREAGNITDLDLALERAAHEESKIELAEAEVRLAVLRPRLDALMGVFGDRTTWRLASRLPDLPSEEMDLAGLERRAIERSLDLAGLRQEVIAAGERVGLARRFALFPFLELGASAEKELGEEAWGVGPAMSLPIPIFNQGQPAVAVARALLRRVDALRAAIAIEVRAAVRAARARTLAARERVQYYRQVLLPLRENIVEQTQLQYNAMQVGVFRLLEARREQIETGARYIRELREYWLARTELELLLAGRLRRIEMPAMGGGRERERMRPEGRRLEDEGGIEEELGGVEGGH